MNCKKSNGAKECVTTSYTGVVHKTSSETVVFGHQDMLDYAMASTKSGSLMTN